MKMNHLPSRISFSPIIILANNLLDAQFTAVEESLSEYPDLLENDIALAFQIAAVQNMKDQNCEQANLAFKLIV